MAMQNIKILLLEHINKLLDERIETAKRSILSARESRDSDTKSSAGDKYETGREMVQQEMDKYQLQLSNTRALKNDLSRMKPEEKHDQVGFGSLVVTSCGNYFISVPIGKISIQPEDVYCISMASPVGRLLNGKKEGEQFLFRGKNQAVHTIL